MIKPIIFGLVAFLLSLGGTTFVMVKRAPPVEVATAAVKDSAAAGKGGKGTDSTHTRRDSTQRKDSTTRSDSLAKPPLGHPAPVLSGPVPAPVASKHVIDPVAKAAAVKQVARVLSAMKAAEAAKVLAFLSDEEVEGILRAVGPRQAADFMTNLPKERAASLSRRLMAVKS